MTVNFKINPRINPAFTCERCIFFEPDVKERDICDGECRRNPPTVYIEEGTSEAYGQWPRVDDEEWCGEFQLFPLRKKE